MSQSPREGGASAVPRPRGATWRDAAGTRASSVRRCVTSDVNRPTLWWYCGAVTSARFDERQVLPLAMFFGSFSWSFVYISLPFHIQRISTSDAAGTLTWTGWIMGITPLATVLTAPLWGRWAERGNPRTLNAMVQVTQGLAFLGTAAARTLIELFLCRIVLGVTGAASTFAFVSAGRSDDPRVVRARGRDPLRLRRARALGHARAERRRRVRRQRGPAELARRLRRGRHRARRLDPDLLPHLDPAAGALRPRRRRRSHAGSRRPRHLRLRRRRRARLRPGLAARRPAARAPADLRAARALVDLRRDRKST